MNTTLMVLSIAALVLAGSSSALAYWMYLQIQRTRRRQEELAGSLASALRELELLAALAVKAGNRVNRLEKEHAACGERLEALEVRGESRAFDRAIDSARNGSDSSKLARQFGLSATEASLLTVVHGGKRRA